MTDPALRRLALGTLLGAFPGPSLPVWAEALLRDGLAGYVLFGTNVVDAGQVRRLVRRIRDAAPDAVVAIDEEGGDVSRLGHDGGSRYPGNAALGVVDDVDLTYRVHHAIGRELCDLGIGVNLSPSVDVNSSDENPVIGTRSFGGDPERVARHGAAAVRGLQDAGVVACAKHFPGHGATVTDSHDGLPTVDVRPGVLRRRELPPFAAAVAAGARAVMTAHIRVPELTGAAPATFSRRVLTDLLREELKFTGTIVTDALEMGGASAVTGIPEAAVRALAAGADALCIGARVDPPLVAATASAIVDAVREGRLPADRVAEAARRTAALAEPPRPASAPRPAVDDSGDGDLGVTAARRALRVEGRLPRLERPLVVQIEAPVSVAAGVRPWGLAEYLDGSAGAVVQVGSGNDPDGGTVRDLLRPAREHPDPVGGPVRDLLEAVRGRQVVVVSRDTHRHPFARRLLERLTARSDQVVLVEMGWPGAWRPPGVRAWLATYGAAPVNARAAAETLLRG